VLPCVQRVPPALCIAAEGAVTGMSALNILGAVAGAATGTTTTWLDPLIFVIVAGSAAIGLFRGLIRSLAGFAGLLLGALFAGRLAAQIDPTLEQANIQHPPIGGAIAFALAFLAIYIAVEFAANLLRFLQRVLLLGWVDRIGGAVFGLLRGVVISMVLLAGMAMFGSSGFNGTMKQAQLAVFLWQNMPAMAGMLPKGMKDSTIRLVMDQAPFTRELAPSP